MLWILDQLVVNRIRAFHGNARTIVLVFSSWCCISLHPSHFQWEQLPTLNVSPECILHFFEFTDESLQQAHFSFKILKDENNKKKSYNREEEEKNFPTSKRVKVRVTLKQFHCDTIRAVSLVVASIWALTLEFIQLHEAQCMLGGKYFTQHKDRERDRHTDQLGGLWTSYKWLSPKGEEMWRSYEKERLKVVSFLWSSKSRKQRQQSELSHFPAFAKFKWEYRQ